MHLNWTQDLEIGVKEIDEQHRAMVEAANGLTEMINKGGSDRGFGEFMEFVRSHMEEHFENEEGYMERFGYEDVAGHRQYHEEFAKLFAETRDKFEKGGASAFLMIQTQRWILEWFQQHISGADKAFGAFLRPKLEARR